MQGSLSPARCEHIKQDSTFQTELCSLPLLTLLGGVLTGRGWELGAWDLVRSEGSFMGPEYGV